MTESGKKNGTILAFLRARLDEDEWLAEHVRDVAVRLGQYAHITVPEQSSIGLMPRRLYTYNPARLLREVEAKRRIVELHTGSHECSSWDHVSREYESCCWVPEYETCSTVRLLALPYSDHPDYDPSWRP